MRAANLPALSATRTLLALVVVAAAVHAAGCGGGGDDEKGGAGGGGARPHADEKASEGASDENLTPEEQMQRAAAETAKNLREMNAGKDVKAVEPAKLKELLPASFAGCKRANTSSQHVNQMGMDIAESEADFEPEPSDAQAPQARFHLKVSDMGNLSGAMGMGMVSWATISIDRESDEGWEKTAKYGSWPAHEEWRNDGNSGTVQVWVAKRFIVEAEGWDTTIEDVRKLAQTVDFSKLESLAK